MQRAAQNKAPQGVCVIGGKCDKCLILNYDGEIKRDLVTIGKDSEIIENDENVCMSTESLSSTMVQIQQKKHYYYRDERMTHLS